MCRRLDLYGRELLAVDGTRIKAVNNKDRNFTNDVRSVSRLENEAVLDRIAERLKKRPEILDRRREVVEHPFGSIKQWMHQGAFLMRGLANVRAEFSLTALAYNLRRALNILSVEVLTAAAIA